MAELLVAEPLVLAAAAFLTVIVVGTVLVGVNDWLEARYRVAIAGGSGGLGRTRSSSVVKPAGRRRLPGNRSRVPLLRSAGAERRLRRGRVTGRWY